MLSASSIKISLAGSVLILSILGDLRARKVKNSLVVFLAISSLLVVGLMEGQAGLITATFSIVTATVAVLPIYVARILGGGDVKLYMALSLLTDWTGALYILAGSFVWGALLGLVIVLLKGQWKSFANNMMSLFWRVRPSEEQTHKIPYTVALALGYASHFSLRALL